MLVAQVAAYEITGKLGAGGMATEGTGAECARDLGQGWKVSPSVRIEPGQTFELADIEKQIDDRTRLIQVSHVSFVNGDTMDLDALTEMAHEHGAKVLVDATQAVGALDVDYHKSGVDYVSVAP